MNGTDVFPGQLRKLRTQYLALSQREAAKILGVSHVTYNRWERGLAVPRRSNVRHMAETFNVPVSWLTGAGDDE